MINKIKKQAKNFLGWQTKRKIVVIESDDWGSIALKSKNTVKNLENKKISVPNTAFARFDTLESNTDLEELYQVLSKYKDRNGNPACITTCSIMANPDFERIEASGFNEYFYETFDKTYERYPNHNKSFEYLKQGISEKLVYPQFHGREHLNPVAWLQTLRDKGSYELELFKEQSLIELSGKKTSGRFNGYFAAFDYESEEELLGFEKVISEGQKIFEDKFGFRSKSFVAPTGIRSDRMDKFLVKNDIIYHQLGQQFLPPSEVKYAIRHRLFGATNSLGQLYWRRNGFFEPSRDRKRDWVKETLLDADAAFKMNKPFVISSHRVNYVGGVSEENRSNGLKLLGNLLESILKIYPDVEFLNSETLGDEISKHPKYAMGIKLSKYRDQKYNPNR